MSSAAEFLAESKRLEEVVECSCWPTPEKYHFVHYGATEPGSAWEQNPDCPVHGTSEWVEGARAALPKLREALEAVLAIHEPSLTLPVPDDDLRLCRGCGGDWPCVEVRAIESALAEEEER